MSERRETWFDPSSSQTVIVPDDLRETFDAAQASVKQYFTNFVADPATGRIEIGDDRYVLVRASALSIDFLDTVAQLYGDREQSEAQAIGRAFLFDIAHTIGKNDARSFHKKMGLTDPLARLATGPVHFAYSGWALVSLSGELNPSPDDDFVLVYDHPYSFEADSWLRAERTSKTPVCIMNSGYSSGWTEESFGMGLTSVEIACKARGDKACTFIMAPPHRIEERLREYADELPVEVSIPSYFARKREEDALRSSERRLGSMLAAMPLPVLIAGSDSKLMYCNSHAETVFGLEPASRGTLSSVSLFGEEDTLGELLASVEAGEQIIGREHTMRDATDNLFPALVSCHPLVLPDGESGVVITAQDVTDFKQAQAALRSNERMATVGTLAAGVAHEVNNPLAYVIANLEHIDEALATSGDSQVDIAAIRHSVGRALEGAQRVRRIVHDLRTLSRDDAGDSSDVATVVSVGEVLEEAVAMSELTWRHRARIRLDIEPDLYVEADIGRLGQVFLNIIVNAAHAIAEGAVESNEIAISAKAASSSWLTVVITDTGRGMAAEEKERIYDPFFTTKEVGEGTGLGLAISKSIIDKLGGEIEVESELGRGTAITIVLRRAQRAQQSQEPAAKVQPEATDLAGLRILIVDDEPALTEILSEMLSECDVTIADSGADARRVLDQSKFDAILCDLMMPDVTGMELYETCEPEVRMRMIFMTGGAFSDAAAVFLRAIENPCLEKPVELAELRAAIATHVAGSR